MKTMSKTLLGATALVALVAVACDKPADRERAAQNELTEAKVEADKKVANAQAEATHDVDKARAEANKDFAQANVDFQKARVDYRAERQKDLAELDKDIADLELDAKKATGQKRIDLDQRLVTIHTQRDLYGRELVDVDTATPGTWDATKARLDRDWDALKKTIRRAD